MNKKAFTLAEVLITLTILGVVAMLIVPNIMHKIQDRMTVTRVKTAYSILENAMHTIVIENGEIQTWNWPVQTNYDKTDNISYLGSILKQYLNISEDCSGKTSGDCQRYYIKKLQGEVGVNGSYINNYYNNTLVLKNGMTLTFFPAEVLSTKGTSPNILLRLDVNGKKGPNRRGYDIFDFYIDYKGDIITRFLDSRHCNALEPYTLANDMNGAGCFLWIIRHGNMDYKFRNVSSEW